MKETALYIHIPFCAHKCIYCDFYSIITNERSSEYINALTNELDYYSSKYKNRKITSIFFGGGTPSMLLPDQIEIILNAASKSFILESGLEITMECNPGTVSKSKLEGYKAAGVNRLSFGVQSFYEDDLKFLTRIHSEQEVYDSLTLADIAGFDNLSIDLIFNLPNQTLERWTANLKKAFSLPIKHLSAYSLILEPGTILNKMVLDGKVKINDDDYDADLYQEAIALITAEGFKQYEVSNFAMEGYECRHNNSYWHYKDYLGLGTSAHSFMDGKRWKNYSALSFYLESIKKNANAAIDLEIISVDKMLDEYIMGYFRSSGIKLLEVEKLFGKSWYVHNKNLIKLLEREGFVKIDNSIISLTPKGYPVCDEILAKFK